MIFLLSVFSLIHVTFYMLLIRNWKKLECAKNADCSGLTFSIIIPARNEEKNILNLLHDLERQTYPKELYEVIVVDDFSVDHTREKVASFIKSSEMNLKLMDLEDNQGKKHALTRGIDSASNEIILTTDADCSVPNTWVEAFSLVFDDDTQIVAGPVALTGNGVFSELQKVEFAGLVTFGGVTIALNNPSMCSGANLSFRKAAFQEIGGYQKNIRIPTGDDEFLLFDIMTNYPNSGKFLKSAEGIVETPVHKSIRAFLNQRIRWVSKWKYNQNWKLRLTAVIFFLDYFLFSLGFIATLIGLLGIKFLAFLLVIRLVSNFLFFHSIKPFFSLKRLLLVFVIFQIFYPFHVFFMGLQSIFGRYTWKDRKY